MVRDNILTVRSLNGGAKWSKKLDLTKILFRGNDEANRPARKRSSAVKFQIWSTATKKAAIAEWIR